MTRRFSSSRVASRARLVALAFAIAAVAPTTVHADDASEEPLVQRGLELRRRGEDAEALRAFEQAYEARPSPRVRAQIALAHQALGMWIEAETGLLDALDAKDDVWITRNRSPLETALASVQRHLAWLEVTVNVPDAQILANGVVLRVVPGNASRVVAGVVVLEVRADGYEPVQRRLEIAASGRAREVVTLARVVVAAPSPSATAPSERPSQRDAVASAPSSDARRTVAWLTAGGAVVFLATGIVAHVARENLAGIYLDDSRCFYGTQSREERCGSYRQSAQAAQWVAIGSYAVAGIAATASVYLFFSTPASRSRGVGARGPTWRCAPGVLSVACDGEF